MPRICGICPVAYQMSAIYGLEELFGVQVPPGTHELRRLLYLGEWIESHMLHVHLLALPDYLGFDDAIQLAKAGFKDAVERGLRLKRLGNDLMATIGGREIHPVSPRVGGFSKAASKRGLEGYLPRLEDAAADLLDVAGLVASLEMPAYPRETEMVGIVDPDEYGICRGSMASTGGRRWAFADHETVTEEVHVAHSNALHSVFADTKEPYFLGPLARVSLNAAQLPPFARDVMERAGLVLPTADPFAGMAARVVETALAVAEAIELIRAYEPPDPPQTPVTPRAGRAMWATEAPRGTLYHRYDVADDGTIVEAKIVPPTAQNLRHIEKDLWELLPTVLERPDRDVARFAEMVVRNYDPCISCATHFLRLDIERA